LICLDNYPEPGKRPLSSTVPTIIEHPDGSFFVAIGGSGGSRIFGAVFQTLLNLDLGLDISQAVEFGRLHDQLFPLILDTDSVYPPDLLDGLRDRGHNVTGAFKRALGLESPTYDDLISVLDVNRVAAVIQAVVQQNGKITGEF
jgi:gamma-glutamyltranspeptidase / glutathione hydrolase / leukotriene-C4 hydrolase